MSQTTVNLGMVPNNRGEYNSAETYYKDNIVQYNGSSYICTAAMDLEHPSGITGVAPYDSDPTQPNTGWAVFVNNQGGGDDGIYDVSAAHMTDNTPKSYNSLSDALADIIVAKRKGGMSIRFLLQLYTVVKSTTTTDPSSDTRYHTVTYDLPDSGTHVASDFTSAFSTNLAGLVAGTASYYYKEESGGTYTTWTVTKVQSSDNNYIQFRYTLPYENTTAGNAAFLNVTNWQGVDDEPTAGSENLVKSGGVAEYLAKEITEYNNPTTEIGAMSLDGTVNLEATSYRIVRPIALNPGDTIIINHGNSTYIGWNTTLLFETNASGDWENSIITQATAGGSTITNARYTNTRSGIMYVGICYQDPVCYSIVKNVPAASNGNTIVGWINTEAFTVANATYTDGEIDSPVSVTWPDDVSGTLTITRTNGFVTKVVAVHGNDSYDYIITRNADGSVTDTTIVKN